jgi:sulfite exporter TauE/SafE
MTIAPLLSAWLVGALGGAHCFAMCGGLVGALGARDAASAVPLVPARAIAIGQAHYHVGRVATYSLLGAAFGAAGGATLGVLDVLAIQRAIQVAANVFLLMLGASLVMRVPALTSLQRAGVHAFAPLLQVLGPVLRRPGAAGRVAMGFAWGLMPCALVYGVLPLALLAGSAWQGGAVMLAFGLGTVPNLLGGGLLIARASRILSQQSLRRAGAVVICAFALVGLARALLGSGALAQGAFCLVP